jgi:hypothetical protein
MTINIHRETAKIYEFPFSARRRLENGRTVPTGIFDAATSVVDICFYHEEAVREGEPRMGDRPKPC